MMLLKMSSISQTGLDDWPGGDSANLNDFEELHIGESKTKLPKQYDELKQQIDTTKH